MSKQISAWDQHKRDQEIRLLQRENARMIAAEEDREYENSLRRRCAVEPYRSPFHNKASQIRSKLGKKLDH